MVSSVINTTSQQVHIEDDINDQTKKTKHIPALDNLRGVAVVFVLLIHASYGIVKGGWVGVNLFFVLSGYLITSLLLVEHANTGKISIVKFYIRRALRLFPALIVGVILANALWAHNKTINAGSNELLATIASLFYFINLLPRQFSGSLVHLWSLSVEEHFYFLWPLISSLVLFKLSLRNQVAFLACLIVLVSVYRICQYNLNFQFNNPYLVIDPNRFTFCSIDGIMFGALMAVILTNPKITALYLNSKKSTWLLIAVFAIFAVILATLDTNKYYYNGGFILIDLLCTTTIFIAIKNPTHYLLSNKTIHWIGTRSYGIYVYHYPIFAAFEPLRHPNSFSNLILVTAIRIVVSFAFAELSFRFIEQPILKKKTNWLQ